MKSSSSISFRTSSSLKVEIKPLLLEVEPFEEPIEKLEEDIFQVFK
jgi:hypothetical protein